MADRLRAALLRWYDAGHRDLPWRGSRDPYRVWVSEVMLQQTTVAAAVPYFERWMARFPDVRSLAEATESEVLAAWQGLGYYRRARNLHAGAQRVVEQGWPVSSSEWLGMPGVGKYTAGAIASITRDERVPAVDGNVQRTYSRLVGGPDVRLWAAKLADCDRPGDVNQALMDLGATLCKPRDPDCRDCPVRRFCRAHREGRQREPWAARPRPRQVALEHSYVVNVCGPRFGVRRFAEGEWWSGMYGFPFRNGEGPVAELGTVRHTVTRHRVTATAALHRCRSKSPALVWKTARELESLPMPTPHRKILALAQARLGSADRF